MNQVFSAMKLQITYCLFNKLDSVVYDMYLYEHI
jgi:hypothetical protein